MVAGSMVTISGEYEGELSCRARHDPSGQGLATTAPVDNGGRGDAFSPTDLVATAMGTCMATIMAKAAQTRGLELRGLRFKVTKHMSDDAPRRIAKLATEFWVPHPRSAFPTGLLERAATTCPVHQSLHPAIQKPVIFHGTDDERSA